MCTWIIWKKTLHFMAKTELKAQRRIEEEETWTYTPEILILISPWKKMSLNTQLTTLASYFSCTRHSHQVRNLAVPIKVNYLVKMTTCQVWVGKSTIKADCKGTQEVTEYVSLWKRSSYQYLLHPSRHAKISWFFFFQLRGACMLLPLQRFIIALIINIIIFSSPNYFPRCGLF